MKKRPERLRAARVIVLVSCSLLIVLFQFIFSQIISSDFSSHMYNHREKSVKKMVELAYNTIQPVIEDIRSGKISSSEGKRLICDTVRAMTYEDEFGPNYIFMSSYDGTMLVQPYEREKEGTNQWNLKDAKGNHIIQMLVNAAKTKPSGSYVSYHYFPPNKNKAEEKLSYVIGIPEIEAYIGTGMYVESSFFDLKRILDLQKFGFLGLSVFIMLALVAYAVILVQSNYRLSVEIKERTYLAYYDYLTGLPNRVSVVNRLRENLMKSTVGASSGTVFYIGIDNFKIVNDAFGHSYGDKVLVEISRSLKTLISDNVDVGRISGDEFIVIQHSNSDQAQINNMVERIRELFNRSMYVDKNNVQITCSIGVAVYPRDGSDTEEILKNADLAMYKAKAMGKNSYAFYDSRLAAELSERVEMENHLKLALANNEFELFYQPQVNSTDGRISGYEALIRWNSKAYGFVSPLRFIHIAEESGLINDIGRWVIDETFAFAARHKGENIYVSCNVSSKQLFQKTFVEDVMHYFQKYSLEEGSVAIEITESCLIESFGEITEKLAQLRQNGILISLDDFGTGYSSLTYLKDLPIDIVKIDKSFIRGIVEDGVEVRIVKTIISLAHEIGLEVVAEGVETSEQMKYLAECECNYIQGYLISKPVPEREICIISGE
ncbi:MAG: EAL domain-containing protein [Clostridia bacterium]|nr:EAL domain-containing protein [Clostridia bacterium]